MSLKYSGLLFVLSITLVAINGTALNNAPIGKIQTQDVSPAPHSSSQSENVAATTESVKIIIPNTSEIISKTNQTSVLKDLKDGSSTTTPPTTTTSTTTSSTTTTTTTTTTPATTTTTTTTPAPAPEKNIWVVRNETSKTTCIIAGMAMQLNITYPSANQSEINKIVNVPKDAVASGNCSQSNQTMVISWGPGHSLQINFSSNKTAKTFYISELSLNVNATVFTGRPDEFWRLKNTSSEFSTPLEMSYKCNKVQDLDLKNANGNDTLKAVLSLKDTQFEAFMNKTKPEFGAVQDCDTFDTPDIVPIAVGCALAILVLVVLVAYLIGRKRSQNQGYLSM